MKFLCFSKVLMGLLLLQVSSMVIAHPCTTMLSALKLERHLTLVKQSEREQTTQYRFSPIIGLSLSCSLGKPNIAIYWDGPAPDQSFYDLIGRAGSLVSARSAAEIVKASKNCRKNALRDGNEIATVEQEGLVIECQAFTRDGGGTIITVFAE